MFIGLEGVCCSGFFLLFYICNLWVDVVDFTLDWCLDFKGENNADGIVVPKRLILIEPPSHII